MSPPICSSAPLYDLGSDQSYERGPLAGGASLAIHESQSRMWENLVGRSLSFWEHFYPEFQKLFPARVGNIDLKTFYKGINKVEPSLIRVNADEATYNLHIMVRLELEIGMIEGAMKVKDLPDIWNVKMEEYLGIVPRMTPRVFCRIFTGRGGCWGIFPPTRLAI